MIQCINIGQKALFHSRDKVQKSNFGQNLTFKSAGTTLKIRSRLPESNQLFPPLQQCIYASLFKINPLV